MTCDLWRSPFQENFLGVTCHWIDEKRSMQKRIIGFEVIESEKNGYLLKNALMTVFTNFGIQNKILSLGVDNASSNTKCIDYMFESRCLDFLVKDFFHVRCVCHVLNLCVQDGIQTLSYIVNPVRKAIRWIRSADRNRRSFKEACRNKSVPYKSFNLDMPIKWGSTYKLLRDTYIYKEIISDLYNNAMGEDILTQDLWDVAQAFCSLLAIFDKATTHFSYVYQPTINDVVVKIVEIIVELSSYTPSHPLLDCVLSMKSKLLKYFFDMPKLILISAILDPRYIRPVYQTINNIIT